MFCWWVVGNVVVVVCFVVVIVCVDFCDLCVVDVVVDGGVCYWYW